MKKATRKEKEIVLQLLTEAFSKNQSVNYVIKQDKQREQRIRALMDYSFEVCYLYGEVFLSEDNKGCALLLYPEKKRVTLKTAFLDFKLVFQALGLSNILKSLKREKLISNIQPKIPLLYLWFIAVDPSSQGLGIGSKLLEEIIHYGYDIKRPIFLETSTVKNLPWYGKFGFDIYNEIDITYHLYFLRREVK